MYTPVSLILSVGLLASNILAAPVPEPDTNGKCRVHIKQSATNWIDWVEIFSTDGGSIGNSWGDPRYPEGARASDNMDITLKGKDDLITFGGHNDALGRNWEWDLYFYYRGQRYGTKEGNCNVGGWDDAKGAEKELRLTAPSLFASIHRDMDCYFTC
ncbi:hypothetical protein G7Z17_g1566 [Cylindrodendrum hubeiense]|uniref:Uncharacterized protein n=1 Tax=Cylindrodendrum hubeiense TaxID=595255 RepID=A0A9P5HJH5_9HYPO|nr:hypothetical protein G7Z17_g1566 [Cylindrodendrum hubeiense]